MKTPSQGPQFKEIYEDQIKEETKDDQSDSTRHVLSQQISSNSHSKSGRMSPKIAPIKNKKIIEQIFDEELMEQPIQPV